MRAATAVRDAVCVQGKDVGRSVSAWGLWVDMLNGPYHCFGTVAEDAGLFKVLACCAMLATVHT